MVRHREYRAYTMYRMVYAVVYCPIDEIKPYIVHGLYHVVVSAEIW